MTITIIRAIIIYFFVVLAVRIMGRRQIGELSTHEFVITILISAVATVPLEDNEIPLANSLLPILILISLEIIQSILSMKSPKFRSLFEGNPILIIKDGKLNQRELKRLRITIDDILDNLRQREVFDISEVEHAVVEANGKLSVKKKSDSSAFTVPLITDEIIDCEYFKNMKTDKRKIEEILKENNLKKEDVMLLGIDKSGKVTVILKEIK